MWKYFHSLVKGTFQRMYGMKFYPTIGNFFYIVFSGLFSPPSKIYLKSKITINIVYNSVFSTDLTNKSHLTGTR